MAFTPSFRLSFIVFIASSLLGATANEHLNPRHGSAILKVDRSQSAAASSTGSAGATPTRLISQHYPYDKLPYQVDTYTGGRGPQFGYNLCNETHTAHCQTLFFNSINDFCFWAPADANSTIAETETQVVAWCTDPKHHTLVFPPGTFQGIQVIKTPEYMQIVGVYDPTKVNLRSAKEGGELDSFAEDGRGNPIGGMAYTTAFGGEGPQQVSMWSFFLDGNLFCAKICNPKGKNPRATCAHRYDRMGCRFNMPSAYDSLPGKYETCDGEPQGIVGEYTVSGTVETWSQPDGPIATVPYTPAIPSSSNCVAFPANSILAGANSGAPAPGPSGSASAQQQHSATTSAGASGSAGPSISRRSSGASASATSSTGASSRMFESKGIMSIAAFSVVALFVCFA